MSGILGVKVVLEKIIGDVNFNSLVQNYNSCYISAECWSVKFPSR